VNKYATDFSKHSVKVETQALVLDINGFLMYIIVTGKERYFMNVLMSKENN
jgi:hypothetical protein